MNIPEGKYLNFQYQFKGRIIQVGLCGTACVSEYAPHHNLLFTTQTNCYSLKINNNAVILKDLLILVKKIKNFLKSSTKTKNFYEDEKNLKKHLII